MTWRPSLPLVTFVAMGDTLDALIANADVQVERVAGSTWKVHSIRYGTIESDDYDLVQTCDGQSIMLSITWKCEVQVYLTPVNSGERPVDYDG